MRVLNFICENFKRIQVVEIRPNGALVDIVGKNGAGKSSVLDAVWAALGGADAVPGEPIRKGEDRGRIELTLGDGEKVALVVKRTFSRKAEGGSTSQIAVEAADGARYAKPQTILDGLLGSLSFDPLAFTRMPAKDQAAALQKLVPDVDFDAIDASNRGDFERRTEISRDAKALHARLNALRIPGDPRQERVDESALVAELEAVGEKKAAIEREAARRTEMLRTAREHREEAVRERQVVESFRERIAELEEELAELKERISLREQRAAIHDVAADQVVSEAEALPPLEEAPNTAAIKARIDAASKANAEVAERDRAIKAREAMVAELEQLDKASDELTTRIGGRNAAKAAAVSAANLPIEGLQLGDGEVLLNGLPLSQASDAEQLRVSVAIAAAMNPKLRVIRVRDGSLLDDDGLKLLAEFAEKHDLQVWLERVASNATTGIVLENGMVKASADTEAAA